MKNNNLDSLLLDIINIVIYMDGARRYNFWEKPQLQENIDWFNSKAKEKGISFKAAIHNDELLEERLQFFIENGLDLTNKLYEISKVNRPLLFKKALDNGANPNIVSDDKYDSLLEETISKGQHSLAKILIEHSSFAWKFKNTGYPNILFKCVLHQKFELANLIAIKKPEFILQNENNPSIPYFVASFMYNNEDNKEKLLSFVEYCANYAQSKNVPFDINEIYKGAMLFEISMDVAGVIKKVEAEYLKYELQNNNESQIKKIKL